MPVSGWSMLARCTEILGRCGGGAPQRAFFPLYCQSNGVQQQIYRLQCSGLAGHDAVAVKVPDHGQISYAVLCVDVRNICYPFAVGLSAWNRRFSKCSYVCTCRPILTLFLRRRISASKLYCSLIRRIVLRWGWMPRFSSTIHILRQPYVRKLRSLCSAMISARAASFSSLPG